MSTEVKLEQLYSFLDGIDYPCSTVEAAEQVDDVTLVLADGTVEFEAILDQSTSETFASADELGNEVMSLLPREAVGEPYQSEGEGD